MARFSDSRVDARLNADGTFTLTVHPTAPRDAILHGLLTLPADTVFTTTPASRSAPAVLLFTPRKGNSGPATGGWVPPVPPAHDPGGAGRDAVQAAFTTLLAATVLDLPGITDHPEASTLHTALGRLLRSGPDDPPPWRSPRTP
ncbi:hypothetical protein [Parafrankia sp. BMG5.11]|uniref:hypothetical protein n=1 Tax=Parafrankia sp. BMG5.11 TaxID=222540 RepID=UPI00103A55F2|nr:hypothetical protein [Parafrankia sp. BMG5.11]TCJ36549.1 hypothetical protein E0504_22680 [Parafrankia sp. BMG5.11]